MNQERLSIENGIGAARIPRSEWPREQLQQRNREMLYRAMNLRTTVAVVGTGLSIPFGYPDWRGFVKNALEMAKDSVTKDSERVRRIESLEAVLRSVGVGSAEYLSILGEAKQICRDPNNSTDVGEEFAKKLAIRFRAPHTDRSVSSEDRSPLAALLDLPIHRFVTSNYDCELERQLAYRDARRGWPTVEQRWYPFLHWQDDGALVDWPGRLAVDQKGTVETSSPPAWPAEELKLWQPRRSFTQDQKNAEQLAKFVLARRPDQREPEMVFHCHGRCDEPKSLVATEQDYQDWYFNRRDVSRNAYRQTIELLLGSNPILFVGFGLADEDLLRPLRMLGASDPSHKDDRPLFALLDVGDLTEEDALTKADLYLLRYGVHIIWYPWLSGQSDPDDKTARVTEELRFLKEGWETWQIEWPKKPKLRELEIPVLSKPQTTARSVKPVLIHHELIGANEQETYKVRRTSGLAGTRVERDLGRIVDLLAEREKTKVVVLLGSGGAGKSHRALELIRRLRDDDPIESDTGVSTDSLSFLFDGGFYWSSYYADDWQTGVDRAIQFLESEQVRRVVERTPDGGPTYAEVKGRCAKLTWLLRNRQSLLVFDGFERLLRTTDDNPQEGCAYNSNVRDFLHLIQDPESKTVVVLTSRLWPKELGSLELADEALRKRQGRARKISDETGGASTKRDPKATGAFLYRIDPLTAVDLRDDKFDDPRPSSRGKFLDRDEVGRFTSLLQGHPYALRILQAWLGRITPGTEAYHDLIRLLQRTSPENRVSRMIGEAISGFERNGSEEPDLESVAIRGGFLERIAVFMSPVGDGVLRICLSEASKGVERKAVLERKTLVEDLIDRRLLFKVKAKGAAEYTLHPLVRGHVFHRLHGARRDELPNFSLPGFTTGTTPVYPGSKRAGELVKSLLTSLIDGAQSARSGGTTNDINEARDLCRAAFGVMRSRMEATTAARWCPYREYIRFSVRLLNLVKAHAGKDLWTHADAREAATNKNGTGVLYPEELAWLYNELGLACCCEGSMHDAYAVWEQGYEVNKLVEEGEDTGQFIVQSKLHFSHTFMELGNIDSADEWLEVTVRANFVLDNADFDGRILGYKGLLAHLRGNLKEAELFYARAHLVLRRAGGNPRAESIFLRHRTDLLISVNNLEKADELLRVARALAETHGHPDLVAYMRCSLGHLRRAHGDFDVARFEYKAALSEARRMGIRRLESDVLSELSRLALNQGDTETARTRAMEGMQIANELGLGLRQCHGLVVLGLAALQADQRDLGIAYLRVAYKLSRDNGYWLRAQEADEELRKLGETPEDLDKEKYGDEFSI